MSKILKSVLIVVGIVIVLLLGLVLFLTVTEYRPKWIEPVNVTQKSDKNLPSTFTIFDWNIGYGALGENVDFFYDGGDTIISPKSEYDNYIAGILRTVKGSNADIFYFQEVDINSKRSYYENQLEKLSGTLSDYSSVFATNYKVGYIPPPKLFRTSFGKIDAGIAMFSNYNISSSDRFSLPGGYSWPKSTLFLDRCMLISRVKAENGSTVVFINTHNSAYDKGGFIKQEQLKYIKEIAVEEYNRGNYVIIGGDWNSFLPGTAIDSYPSTEKASVYNAPFPDNWTIDNWNWAVDPSTASSRSLATSYKKGENYLCLIDGFLVSPNIKIESVITKDLGFEFSDHNPVIAKFSLQ
ncbi:MAG: hypothetical protein B6229_02985 [Spirochaetaceae bacterium 4572_7]|nr:MAG: hypothetical protein B6229_02985 [Spirochaetaceae bacterium 4572_7]